jgi:DNA-binding transcriptional regulator YhcF (GntR family)
MKISFDSLIPVYVQIAEVIEDDIISGKLTEGGAAYSQLIIARALNVNPATAAKGINVLVSKGILEKQRGTSMAVAAGALDRLLKERRGKNFHELVVTLVSEATKINLSENEVITEIKKYYERSEGGQDDGCH